MSAPTDGNRAQLLRELLSHKRAWDRLTMWEAEARGFGDFLLARQIKAAAGMHATQFWLCADALGLSGLTADELSYRARSLAGGGA